ncbi:MAG: histidine kinase [Flavobacteriales bacterium]|nr:histidine kinase [Flavobacteriales bacterium]
MIHLHRAVTTCLVSCLLAFTGLARSVQTRADSAICKAYVDSVEMYSYRYDANDSLKYFGFKVLECAKALGDTVNYVEAISVVGVSYLRENDYPQALKYFQLHKQEMIKYGDSLDLAKSMINLGGVYSQIDSTQKAMEILMESAGILEHYQDSSMLMYVYTNIGILMGAVKNREEQLEFSKMAFAMGGNRIHDQRTLTLATNLSVNYSNSGMNDSALALGNRILTKAREFKNPKNLTQILAHLANVSTKLENYEDALRYADEVLEYENQITHNQTFCSAYTYKGIALGKLGRHKEAIENLEKANDYAKIEGAMQRKTMVLYQLHQAYQKVGDYKLAYNALQEYQLLNDSLRSAENVKILNDLETKYQTEKKEQQVRDLSQQNQISELKLRQRTIWIIVLIIAAIAVAGSIFFVSRQRLLKEQQDALENKLLSLRVQLNPHFIFNALTAVQNYMLSGKDLRQATRYLSNFAKVMRAFLEYNQEETITLDKELYALGLYVGIQELRFSNGFDFEVNVGEDILPEETLVPPMIMQPLIENAIEHGIRNVENGKITLSYNLKGDQLEMRLEDNGIGRKRAAEENKKAENKSSLATKITTERISLLNRKGNGTYTFTMNDANPDGTGTVAVFTIPYQES